MGGLVLKIAGKTTDVHNDIVPGLAIKSAPETKTAAKIKTTTKTV